MDHDDITINENTSETKHKQIDSYSKAQRTNASKTAERRAKQLICSALS